MTEKASEPQQQPTVSVEEFNKLRERAQNFEARVVDFEKRYKNIDPEEHKALKEEIGLLRRETVGGDPKKIEEFLTKERAELEKRFSGKLTETETALQEATKRLKRAEVVNPAMITAAKFFNDDALPLLQPIIEGSLDMEDGKIVVKQDGKIVPSTKNPRLAAMPVEEFLESLIEKHPSLAKPTIGAGGKDSASKRTPSVMGEGKSLQDFASMPDRGREAFKQMKPEDLKKLFTN